MKLTPWLVYLWGTADGIIMAAVGVIFVSGMAAIFSWGFAITEDDDDMRKIAKKVTIVFSIAMAVAVFTPSSKTIAIMYIAPALVNSEAIQQDMPELWKAGVDALKSKLKGKE